MEFLLAKGFRQASPNTQRWLEAACGAQLPSGCFSVQNDDFYFFSNDAPLTTTPGMLSVFDGHLFHDGKIYHPHLPNTAPSTERLLEQSADEQAGVFLSLTVDIASKSFSLLTDPLSQYPILIWQSGARYVISNNALLIDEFLKSRGYRLQRDPACMLFSGLAVMNLHGVAPFKELRYLPPRQRLTGAERLQFRDCFSPSYLLSPEGSYEDHIALAADALSEKWRTVATQLPMHYLLTDITGGIDSRMILAGAFAAGVQDRIAVWSNAKFPHPDGNVADHIIHRFGLNPGSLLLNWHNEWPDYEQKIRRGLFRNRGGRYKDWNGLGTGYFPELLRLGGNLGELGRSNTYSSYLLDDELPLSTLGSAVCRDQYRGGEFQLLTLPAVEHIETALQRGVDARLEAGATRRTLSDLLYLDGRGPYHFGHQSACSAQLCIAPYMAYDINLVRANASLSLAQKASGKAQFDLIGRLAGESLRRIPMAEKRWAADAMDAEMFEQYSSIEIIDRNSERLPFATEAMQWTFCWPMENVDFFAPDEPPEFARGRGHVWLQFARNQNLLKKYLHGMESTDRFFDYVDYDKLNTAANAEPDSIAQKGIVSSMSRILGGLMWHLKLEERVPISEQFTGEYPQG